MSVGTAVQASCLSPSAAAFYARLAEARYAPAVVADIGASNGAWSVTVAEHFPRAEYHLVEPLARARDDYAGVLAWAMREHPSFVLHECAAGEADGEADLWLHPEGVGSTLVRAGERPGRCRRVPVRTLDSLVASGVMPQPSLVKMDVEGAELAVIRGGSRTIGNAEFAQAEVLLRRKPGGAEPLAHEVIEAMMGLGFVLVQIAGSWRRPDGELLLADAMFAHRRVVGRFAAAGDPPWAPAEGEG